MYPQNPSYATGVNSDTVILFIYPFTYSSSVFLSLIIEVKTFKLYIKNAVHIIDIMIPQIAMNTDFKTAKAKTIHRTKNKGIPMFIIQGVRYFLYRKQKRLFVPGDVFMLIFVGSQL